MQTKYDIKKSDIPMLTNFKDYDVEFEDTIKNSLKVKALVGGSRRRYRLLDLLRVSV